MTFMVIFIAEIINNIRFKMQVMMKFFSKVCDLQIY